MPTTKKTTTKKTTAKKATKKTAAKNKAPEKEMFASATEQQPVKGGMKGKSKVSVAKGVSDPQVTKQLDLIDTYLEGNPARHRMPASAKSYYPELNPNGYYSNLASELYKYWEEMLAKDGVIYGCIEQRRSAVLSRDRELIPAGEEEEEQVKQAFVEAALQRIGGQDGGFDTDLKHLLSGVATGISLMEIVWERVPSITITRDNETIDLPGPWILPARLQHRFPGNYTFDRYGTMYFMDESANYYDVDALEAVPERKYLQFRWGGSYENPYGQGLLHHVWWYYYFKRTNLQSWLVYNDKHAIPTVVGTYPPNTDNTEVSNLETAIANIRSDTGITVPEKFKVDLLEAARNGSGNPYQVLCEYCDSCISRAILSSTLTSSEGSHGAYALGKVHRDVANDKIEEDARALMWTINRQLIRWIVDVNFGEDESAPTWLVNTSEDEDLDAISQWLERLFNLGYQIPADYIADKFGVPRPADDEDYVGLDLLRELQGMTQAPPTNKRRTPFDSQQESETYSESELEKKPGLLARIFASKKKDQRMK